MTTNCPLPFHPLLAIFSPALCMKSACPKSRFIVSPFGSISFGSYLLIDSKVYLDIDSTASGSGFFLALFGDQATPGHRRLDRFQPGAGRGAVAVHQLIQDLEVGLGLDPGLSFERQAVFSDVADGQGQFTSEDRRVGQGLVVVRGEVVTGQDGVEVFHPECQVQDEPRVPAVDCFSLEGDRGKDDWLIRVGLGWQVCVVTREKVGEVVFEQGMMACQVHTKGGSMFDGKLQEKSNRMILVEVFNCEAGRNKKAGL